MVDSERVISRVLFVGAFALRPGPLEGVLYEGEVVAYFSESAELMDDFIVRGLIWWPLHVGGEGFFGVRDVPLLCAHEHIESALMIVSAHCLSCRDVEDSLRLLRLPCWSSTLSPKKRFAEDVAAMLGGGQRN